MYNNSKRDVDIGFISYNAEGLCWHYSIDVIIYHKCTSCYAHALYHTTRTSRTCGMMAHSLVCLLSMQGRRGAANEAKSARLGGRGHWAKGLHFNPAQLLSSTEAPAALTRRWQRTGLFLWRFNQQQLRGLCRHPCWGCATNLPSCGPAELWVQILCGCYCPH